MNKNQKKALYESIMKTVSKTVKRKLNESIDYNTYVNELLTEVNDVDDNDTRENILDAVYKLIRELQGYIKDLDDDDMSWEELNKICGTICSILSKQTTHTYTDVDDMK